jgi:hypothetical protein
MSVFNLHYRSLRWLVLLPCLLLLCGCFQYDLTLRFDHQLHGHIEQSITLDGRAAAIANGTLAPWLHALEARTQELGGTVASTGYNQRLLVVPFTTSKDVVRQFSRLFADGQPTAPTAESADPSQEVTATLTIPDLGRVPFHLAFRQQDWIFASRSHLIYDIDLQQLPPATPRIDRAESASWSTLDFRLQTPWGISQVAPESNAPTQNLPNGAGWRLEPGKAYHIEVWFWVPSLVALGAVIIGLLVLLGYFLRYRLWGQAKPSSSRGGG